MLSLLSAAAANAASPPAYLQFLPLVAMAVIFYFLILRPQMKRQKEHQQRLAALQKGDSVITAGGLLGKIVRIDDAYVDLELAPGVRVKAVRSTLGEIVQPGDKPAND
ncbi:preprotein translocase subunit YajC [Novosphingobium capsulatum]|uniref:Sec translocon accessory complex subunit YajC n=1 Tax=Novosphingobium capsulatum TaxID=13688 RepID=A0ABU1MHN0_9SPHN|nr:MULTISPECIES: preprotein translocase subunit YajC [Novosphingobium]KPF55370.1 preprotein translocase subunit YajC [Novosphingobium sp. AAP1]MBB3358425.1 preprotein translocase subunit YajC [Novosphingobium sp. BK256]MBB3374786.1 preprotein translocase subunit YajC [Novosphingobium sp. BK280]MBB3379525.1 preprotein translocase subunit YajC [Novosphingobium sp. BK258]MBB3421220.1 preprotein translocase subunit YajC [Novosphingobium sp. BK267]